jgi:hypothetical protein
MSQKSLAPLIIVTVLAIGAGAGLGYGIRHFTAEEGQNITVGGEQVSISTVAPSDKPEVSPFRLLRAGGKTQTVYLSSTVTDLSKLVGMEVEIWGETQDAAGAGWYMDVGRIKVINVEGISPEATTK